MPRYQPRYCEENVWHLLDDELDGERAWAVFISNPSHRCLMWSQRAATVREGPVIWDYHVVALYRADSAYSIWDLDTTIETPSTAATWLHATFPHGFDGQFGPLFRVVERSEYLETFSSDRSHMRDADGDWRATPPEWDAIFDPERGMNLGRFVDMSSDEGPGALLGAGEFTRRFASQDDERW